MKSIIVTGDVVRDCHLYGGVKTAATSFREPGTVFQSRLGGAALTFDLIGAAADAAGIRWDEKKAQWDQENDRRVKKGQVPMPRPDDLPAERPSYNACLDLETSHLEGLLPTDLHSYGVWTDKAAKKGSSDRVWRVDRHFGYGPTVLPKPGGIFKKKNVDPAGQPDMILIDDGGILFRHEASKSAWPKFSSKGEGHFLLKMSLPLCRGDLWAALEPVMNRLIVVVAAADLRRENAQINARLSWEQCAEHTIYALQNDPAVCGLLGAAHVVVSFRSAGALWASRKSDGPFPRFRLLFDPALLEGDYSLKFEGTAYGFQTCLAAGIAHQIMAESAKAERKGKPGLFADRRKFDAAMTQGIAAGLMARRRLLELGHGFIKEPNPGFPVKSLGQSLAAKTDKFISVDVPKNAGRPAACPWTILGRSEAVASGPGTTAAPLYGLANWAARYGYRWLSHVPSYRLGNLFTVDRSEIESYRMLEGLIRAYEDVKVQKKPLSIGVFGPPGAGKSHGVKALAKGILGDKAPFIEFNLSQFKNPAELIGAFHRVRDAVLEGITPVAFWDEFDSQKFFWLQYLLAPMQDGSFQDGQITHPIGKCVFVFAGGTSPTIEEFGVRLPQDSPGKKASKPSMEERAERHELENCFREFQLLKGPDFISRLHGFLNVLGPNPRGQKDCPDITWPIRRAIMLRGMLGLKDEEVLDIDPGLLFALLGVPVYRHGARSFEKIINALAVGRIDGHLHRSALPPQPLLDRETKAQTFHDLMIQRDILKDSLKPLAAAIHYSYLKDAEKAKLHAAAKGKPHLAWKIHPLVQKVYDKLTDDFKASNRAAARRIPDHLALIGYSINPQSRKDKGSWQAPLRAAIEKHAERLARAEHLGWYEERIDNGWTYGEIRDNVTKRHPALVPWEKLPESDQAKDYASVRSIPKWLETAKLKAVPMRDAP